MGAPADIPPGTLYMLILKSLSRFGSMHGYGIAQHIQQISDDVLQVEEGSLYPALQRMLIKGWVVAEWRQSENNRRARYYTLTPEGRKQLGRELREFQRVNAAIARVMQTA
jgi:PadR family transcriptional regulator, regulatory protein PadR